MFVASQNGHTEVVDLLVQARADIHLATTKVHVSTHTVSSLVAAVVETNVRLINNGRQWRSQGGAKGAIAPPFFKVNTLGVEQSVTS